MKTCSASYRAASISFPALHLGEPGLLLPDIIDIGRKQEFETQTVPRLREVLAQGRFKDLDGLLNWLRQKR
jgi:hypothetical protein